MNMSQWMLVSLIVVITTLITVVNGSDSSSRGIRIEERFSFSLTTFDPTGQLKQVEHAMIGSQLGVPIVAVVVNNTHNDTARASNNCNSCHGPFIVMAAPQLLPSPLMVDDGTSRFVSVNKNIVLAHSGLAGDGRVLSKEAIMRALQHTYLYDEPIPIDLFLEEMSLLMQEYTMKRGCRPFGATLLIGYVPPVVAENDTGDTMKPRLFRIDCSGSVEELGDVAIINGNFRGDDLRSRLWGVARGNGGYDNKSASERRDTELLDVDHDSVEPTDMDKIRWELSQILQEELEKQQYGGLSSSTSSSPPPPMTAQQKLSSWMDKIDQETTDGITTEDSDYTNVDRQRNAQEEGESDELDMNIGTPNKSIQNNESKIKLPLRIISCSFGHPQKGLQVERRLATPRRRDDD